MDLKILVVTHKPYWFPAESLYYPILVGDSPSPEVSIQRDNEGNNISDQNPYFCELTALYWAWKNLDCSHLGLCHYRRYFASSSWTFRSTEKRHLLLDTATYEKLLAKYDVLVPQKRHYWIETVRSHYEHAHYKQDLDTLEQIICERSPEYVESFNTIMRRRSLSLYNMFIMSKQNADKYCSWLFDLLFALSSRIDLSGHDPYNKRVYGFLGERLLNVWLLHQRLKVKELPVVTLEKVDYYKKIRNFLIRKFSSNRV